MRIISGDHDYYDKVQVYGHDPTSVWKRQTHEVEILSETLDFELSKNYKRTSVTHHHNAWPFVIGFCGKLYPCMQITEDELTWPPKSTYHYKADEVVAWLEDKEGERRDKWEKKNLKRDIQDIRWWYDAYRGVSSDLFVRLQAPIWIKPLRRKWGDLIFVNYLLKEYNFQKVFDPVSAFQEIDMYLSGVLTLQQPEMVEIADIDQRDKKGFDDWSFKTRPHTKG